MEALVWIGAAISLLGVGGLVACIFIASKAKRARLGDAEMRARLKRVVLYNTASLMVSALGLMCVVAGIILG